MKKPLHGVFLDAVRFLSYQLVYVTRVMVYKYYIHSQKHERGRASVFAGMPRLVFSFERYNGIYFVRDDSEYEFFSTTLKYKKDYSLNCK